MPTRRDDRSIAVYLRVSSSKQTTASQEPDLKRWTAAQSLPVVWYRDKATGKNQDRPGWHKLEADLRAGRVATLVCWRLDRLGRNARDLLSLFHDLTQRKVNLVSLKEGFDLSSPTGRLAAQMLAAFAEFETELRAERVAAGIEARRAKGLPVGRVPGTHTRIKVTDDQIALIRRLKGEQAPVARIARLVGLSRPTIYSVLSSPLEEQRVK